VFACAQTSGIALPEGRLCERIKLFDARQRNRDNRGVARGLIGELRLGEDHQRACACRQAARSMSGVARTA